MGELIKKAIKALEDSIFDEIELTDGNIKVRVVRSSPNILATYPPTTQVPLSVY